ncbi:LOW QUALITY PROTEIN: XIAP-associated factor 1 [Rhynchocyon petersi]
MEEDIQICKYCNRRVAAAHFTLHAHCARFLVVFPECEPVSKKEIEGHFENWHKEVECPMCHENMQKYLMEVHEVQECQMHQVTYKFCELVVSLDKLEVHEHYCGSRTEHCSSCKQFILLQELAHHKDTSQGEWAQSMKGKIMAVAMRKIICCFCNQMIPLNEYICRMDKCHPGSEFLKLSPFEKPRNAPQSLPSQLSTEENDAHPKTRNGFTLLSETPTKQVPRGKSKFLDLPLKSEL